MNEGQELLLSLAGLRRTKARAEILKFLDKQKAPVSVSQIEHYMQKKSPFVNQATIYRILDLFYKNKIVNRLEFQEGKYRYEIKKDDHHHLICQRCGSISDLEDCDIEKWHKQILQKRQFIVKRHTLEFFGVCAQCQL